MIMLKASAQLFLRTSYFAGDGHIDLSAISTAILAYWPFIAAVDDHNDAELSVNEVEGIVKFTDHDDYPMFRARRILQVVVTIGVQQPLDEGRKLLLSSCRNFSEINKIKKSKTEEAVMAFFAGMAKTVCYPGEEISVRISYDQSYYRSYKCPTEKKSEEEEEG